ncbi:MAG: DUF1232 domain-containing protein [Erysipelotrichaceae bacterium]|nr:DUF1232 domain-containing protein [Erysipelotrichaceae bacterium]
MTEFFDAEKIKEVIENGKGQAKDLLDHPEKVDELLVKMEEELKEVPVGGQVLANIPLMISMVKSYISKEYTDVSVKVILTMISAFLYVVKRKDLIRDNIPFIGFLDDIAVLGVALTFVDPELKAYAEWRNNKA